MELLALEEGDERILLSEEVMILQKFDSGNYDFEDAHFCELGWEWVEVSINKLGNDIYFADVLVILVKQIKLVAMRLLVLR